MIIPPDSTGPENNTAALQQPQAGVLTHLESGYGCPRATVSL